MSVAMINLESAMVDNVTGPFDKFICRDAIFTMQEFNLQAECEEMIGRSQQSVTINPEKLKAAVHKVSEAEK